jgi:GDP-D-mannose 3',5'-epimerase
MKAVVTGAGGFIGIHITEYLVKKGWSVIGVDKKFPEYRNIDIFDEFVIHDLTVPRTDFYKDCDVVFHMACNMGGVGFTSSHAAEQMRDNMLITINVMDGAIANKVERMFYASSACVYNTDYQQDPDNVVRLTEDMSMPAKPDEGYGWEKLYSEMMLQAHEREGHILARIGRFHNIYGEMNSYDDGKEKAPAAICRKISQYDGSEPIEVWGTGEAIRTYLHVDDLVDGIYNLTMSDINTPVNLGSEEEISVIDFYKLVADVAGKDVEFTFNLNAPTGPLGRSCDLTYTRKTLGWEPTQSLREGITRTYNWIDGQIKGRNY